jgi:hypothetical protein
MSEAEVPALDIREKLLRMTEAARFNTAGHYVLDHKRAKPRETYDIREWDRNLGSKVRAVRNCSHSGFTISTIFLGLDHNWMSMVTGSRGRPSYRPILWETMIFSEGTAAGQYRFTSRHEAVRHHRLMCCKLRRAHRRLRARKGLSAMHAAYGRRRR